MAETVSQRIERLKKWCDIHHGRKIRGKVCDKCKEERESELVEEALD